MGHLRFLLVDKEGKFKTSYAPDGEAAIEIPENTFVFGATRNGYSIALKSVYVDPDPPNDMLDIGLTDLECNATQTGFIPPLEDIDFNSKPRKIVTANLNWRPLNENTQNVGT